MTALYRKQGACWLPEPETLGPYPDSQHGGAVAGLTAGVLETRAAELDAGQPLMFSMTLHRPAPLAPVEVTAEAVRSGGRITCLKAETSSQEALCATATAVFARPLPIDTLPPPPQGGVDPSRGQPLLLRRPRDREWFGDVTELRRTEDGTYWLRSTRPVVEPFTPLARVCALADWAPGISMRATGTDWRTLVRGFPTVDLTVHLSRLPAGDWLGMRASTFWYDSGLGMTEAALSDTRGPLGRSAQALVVLPRV